MRAVATQPKAAEQPLRFGMFDEFKEARSHQYCHRNLVGEKHIDASFAEMTDAAFQACHCGLANGDFRERCFSFHADLPPCGLCEFAQEIIPLRTREANVRGEAEFRIHRYLRAGPPAFNRPPEKRLHRTRAIKRSRVESGRAFPQALVQKSLDGCPAVESACGGRPKYQLIYHGRNFSHCSQKPSA